MKIVIGPDSLVDKPMSLKETIKNGSLLLEDGTERIIRIVK